MNFISRYFVSTRRQTYKAKHECRDTLDHKFLVTHIYYFYNVVFIRYLCLPFVDEGHSILDIVVVFLVPCHSGSLAPMYVVYSRQRYKIYFETTRSNGRDMSSPMSLAFYKQKKCWGQRSWGFLYKQKFHNSNLGVF